MKKELVLNVNLVCVDSKSADYTGKLINGMITLAKFGSAVNKNKQPAATDKILENINVVINNNSVQVEIGIDKNNIDDFRKNTMLKKPN